MKNIRFDLGGTERSREAQIQRIRRVIREELTPLQRYTLVAYYFRQKNMVQIAEERSFDREDQQ